MMSHTVRFPSDPEKSVLNTIQSVLLIMICKYPFSLLFMKDEGLIEKITERYKYPIHFSFHVEI
jgi:hypothetical protein